MKVAEIKIHAGDVDRPYKTIGEISAKIQAPTAFSKTPEGSLERVHLGNVGLMFTDSGPSSRARLFSAATSR
jgi:hypothetical protein